MKKQLLLLIVLLFSFVVNGQINISTGGTVSTCSDVFVDSGGLGGNYSSNENYEITICPDVAGNYIDLNFTTFNIEGGSFDFLVIYNGMDTSGGLLGTITEDSACDVTQYTSSGTGGCITIVFVSDGSFNQSGWEASVSCVTSPGSPPAAPPNSVCGGSGAFCADSGALEFPNTANTDCVPDAPNVVVSNSCLGSAPNPAWYFIEIGLAGDIIIDISQTTGAGGTGTGLDVDYVVWGPFPDVASSCADFTAGDCTNDHNCTGTAIDCSYSSDPTETATILNAQVGEFYMFLITNFDGASGFITLTQTNIGNAGAGSTDCCPIAQGTDPTSCGATDGIITISLLTPNTSYTITYNDPAPQSVSMTSDALGVIQITGLVGGTYSNIDTNTPSCSPENIVLNATAGATLTSLSATSPVCSGGDAVFTFVGTPSATVSYDINGGASTTVVLDGTGSGTVTVSGVTANTIITLSNIAINGCDTALTNTATVVVNINPFLTSLTPTTPVCSGGDAVFTLIGTPTATVSYDINGGASTTVVLDGAGNGTVTVSGVTTNTIITLSDIALSGCNTALTTTTTTTTTTTVVVVGSPMLTSLTPTTPVCSGGDAVFTLVGTPTATVSYDINGGASTTVVLDGAGNGTVTVSGVTANTIITLSDIALSGCNTVLISTATVVVNTIPVFTTLSATSPICSGSDAVFALVGTPNSTVSYDINGGVTTTVVLDGAGNGTVTVSGVTTNTIITLSDIALSGCNTVLTNTATVIVNANPVFATLSTTSPVCSGADAVFALVGTANATVSYDINGGATTIVVLNGAGNGMVTVPGVTANTIITLSDIALSGCNTILINTATVVVTENPVLTSLTPTTPVCSGGDAVFTLVGTANATVSYDINGGVTTTIVLDGAGNGTVTVSGITVNTTIALSNIVISGCPIVITNTETVVVNPNPVLTGLMSNGPICTEDDAIFTIIGTPNSVVTYSLDGGGTTQTITLDGSGNGIVTFLAATSNQTIDLSDIQIGAGATACNLALTDTLTIIANLKPYAGTDGSFITCDTATSAIHLIDLITGEQSGGIWAQTSGFGGTFNPNSGIYTPSSGATTATFTYTVVGIPPCIDDVSNVLVSINNTPILGTNSSSNPTSCSGSEGSIILTTSNLPDGSYTINYEDVTTTLQTVTMVVVGNVGTISGLLAGTYNNITVTNLGCISLEDVDVVLTDPLPPTLAINSSIGPGTCSGNNGSISLITSNLPDGSYTINYEDITATPQTATMVVVGNVGVISGLTAGTYNNITVTNNNCTSVENIDIVITDPPLPTLAINSTTNPTTCDGSDGSITLTTSNLPDGSYTINYEDATATPQTAAMVVVGNIGTISGLLEGVYNNIIVMYLNCTSIDNVDVQLFDPLPSIIAIIATNNPTICEGTDGSITLSTSNLPDGTYPVNYEDATATPQTETIVVVGNVGVISGLSEGTYNNITVTFISCTSVEDIDVVLTDPLPSIIAIISTSNPTFCDGTDGSITLSTSNLPDGSYTINYEDATATPQTETMVVVVNIGIISGLLEGTYNNITVTFISCTSVEDIDAILTDPQPAIISIISTSNPTMCNGIDGFITLSTANLPDGTFTINYEDATGTPQTDTIVVVGNVGVISGLSEGTYNNITVTYLSCTSVEDIDVILSDPIPSIIAIISTSNPSTCNGVDGSIVLSTFNLPDATYTIDYEDVNAIAQTATMVVIANVGTITGLSEGTYNNITVTNVGCTSVEDIDVVLIDPFPPQVNNNMNMAPVCENDNIIDGVIPHNLTDNIAAIIGTQSGVTVSFYETLVNATSGMLPIVNDTAYLNINPTPPLSVQTIYVRAQDDVTGCYSTTSFTITVMSIVTNPPTPLAECDDDNDGFYFFMLHNSVTLNEITNGATNVVVAYYETLAEADQGIVNAQLTSPYFNINAYNQTVYARVDLTTISCYRIVELQLNVIDSPALPLNDLIYDLCEDVGSSDGFVVFDLPSYETTDLLAVIIANGGDVSNYATNYYTALDASENPDFTTIIGNPNAYQNISTPNQIIYASVIDNTTGCEAIKSITLQVNLLPIANYTPIEVCDDDTDNGFYTFNLSNYVQAITSGASDVEVSFYETLADAEAGSGPSLIVDPENFTNSANPQSIFARVFNAETGCYAIAIVKLHVNPNPTPLSTADIASDLGILMECDGNVDGSGSIGEQVAEFNLTQWETQILTGTGPAVELGVSANYYISIDDAEAGINAITTPTVYTNIANPQTIYISVVNDGTGINPVTNGTGCYTIVSFEIYVPIPEVTISGSEVLCIDENGVPLTTIPLPILTATAGPNPAASYNYQWALNGVVIVGATSQTLTVSQAGEYTVTVSGPTDFECLNFASQTIIASGVPDNFNANVTTNAFSDSHQIVAIATSNIPEIVFWYSLDDAEPITNGTFDNVSPGIHTITITDDKNCWKEVIEVLIIDYPHFFTPNGDGINDTWQIIGIEGIPISQIYIFDRFGKLLKQLDPDGIGWDGNYNGNQMPSTDYWFKIIYIEGNTTPTQKEFKAHFSLKR